LRSLLFRSRRAPTPTLFPYTTLFRSVEDARQPAVDAVHVVRGDLHRLETAARLQPRRAPPSRRQESAARAWAARRCPGRSTPRRSEEHTSELQSRGHLVCRLLLEKNK